MRTAQSSVALQKLFSGELISRPSISSGARSRNLLLVKRIEYILGSWIVPSFRNHPPLLIFSYAHFVIEPRFRIHEIHLSNSRKYSDSVNTVCLELLTIQTGSEPADGTLVHDIYDTDKKRTHRTNSYRR